MFALLMVHLSQFCRVNASAWDPPCGVRLWIVRLSITRPLVPLKLSRDRLLVLALVPCWVLLLVPRMTVPARSCPRNVMLLFYLTSMISWYMPVLIVMVEAAVLLAGSASVAPCTVQNCPEPSSATDSAERLLGAADTVVNRQAVLPVIDKVPLGGLIAPESTLT